MRFQTALTWMKHGKFLRTPGFLGYWMWNKETQEIIIVTKNNERIRMKDTHDWNFTLGFICSDEWEIYNGPDDPREQNSAPVSSVNDKGDKTSLSSQLVYNDVNDTIEASINLLDRAFYRSVQRLLKGEGVGIELSSEQLTASYMWKGRECLTPLFSLAHSISYDALKDLDLVDSNKVILIKGKRYYIRLMENNEWDAVYGKFVNRGLSEKQLKCRPEKGGAVWVYHPDYVESNFSVRRGTIGVSYLAWRISSNTNSNYGWRPVFEEMAD